MDNSEALPEISSVKARSPSEAHFYTIVNTYNIFIDKYKENNKSTVEMSLYLRDVQFLLECVTIANKEIQRLRNG